MVTLDMKTLTTPVGIVRILEVLLTCCTFSLVASVGEITVSFWTWCMFVWCFCFLVTFLILVLEFTSLSSKLPISWESFTTTYAIVATLMMSSASIIFPFIFACSRCNKFIAASVTSCLAFILYAAEVSLSGFSGLLSMVPGFLKVLEVFVACLIFTCLPNHSIYSYFPGLQWCVAVYSICFIFSFIVIVFMICRLSSLFPASFDQVLTICNVIAVLMYMTAVVIWPYYFLRNNPRPKICLVRRYCPWDTLVVISILTCINLVVYIVDTVYSVRLILSVSTT